MSTNKKGDIRFVDNSIPNLTAGIYEITVKQKVSEPSFGIDAAYETVQHIEVRAERFTIPDTGIYSTFPVKGTTSDYHKSLPFIIFQKEFRHFPWTRRLQAGNAGTTAAPWVALMLFTPDEISYNRPEDSDTRSVYYAVKDIVNLKGNVLGPTLPDVAERDKDPKMKAETIDVDGKLFTELAPSVKELPYLAHVKQINTEGLSSDDAGVEEDYAVVMCNRMPEDKQAGYIVHLVSLEGWADYLPGGTKTFENGQKARLVSLYSWTFTNKPGGADFEALVNKLDTGLLQLPLNTPDDWQATPAQKEVVKRYAEGYVPLNYKTRLGEESFAWYRGPFTPQIPVVVKNLVSKKIDPKGGIPPLASADQAIIYDPATGVFDHSYAVAWEMGRMVTLANRPAALAIHNWKKEGVSKLQVLNKVVTSRANDKKQVLKKGAKADINSLLGHFSSADWHQVLADVTDRHAGITRFINYLGNSLAKHIVPDSNESDNAVINVLDPSGLTQHADSMPGLVDANEMEPVLRNGTDPHAHISRKLKEAQELEKKS